MTTVHIAIYYICLEHYKESYKNKIMFNEGTMQLIMTLSDQVVGSDTASCHGDKAAFKKLA